MPQLAMPWVERAVECVVEIVGTYDAEGADGGQRARLRAAQRVIVIVVVDVLLFEAARQVDVLHEHVSRVHALTVAWV